MVFGDCHMQAFKRKLSELEQGQDSYVSNNRDDDDDADDDDDDDDDDGAYNNDSDDGSQLAVGLADFVHQLFSEYNELAAFL